MTESRDVKFGALCKACNGTGFEPDSPAIAKTIAEMSVKYGIYDDKIRDIVLTYLTHTSENKTVWTTEDPEPPSTVRLRDLDDDVWRYSIRHSRWTCTDDDNPEHKYHWPELASEHKNWFPMTKTDDYDV